MIKANLTQKLSALLVVALAAFASSPVQAQTPIWGAATGSGGAGYADGTMSTAFSSANADPYSNTQLSATQWTTYSLWQCAAANPVVAEMTNDSAHWKRLQAPYDTTSHGPVISNPVGATSFSTGWPSGSPGSADGVAVFDSDYLHATGAYNGNNGPFGGDPTHTCTTHKGELISPRIDLSAEYNATTGVGTNLSLEFYVLHRFFSVPELSVSFSYDDGATWHASADILSAASTAAPGYPSFPTPFLGGTKILIPFPTAWNGYDVFAGHDNTKCRIKFTCEARYYYAFIDEVSIISQPDVDYAIAGGTSSAVSSYFEMASAMQVSNSRYTPSNQVDMSQFLYGARTSNKGAITGYDVPVYFSIEKFDSTGSNCVIYQDTLLVDTLAANEVGRTSNFDSISPSKFVNNFSFATLSDGYSDYVCTYDVFAPANDFDPTNNMITREFSITDDYWSKARLNTNGDPYANAPMLLNRPSFNDFEMGSVFYAASNDVIDSVKVQYYVPGGYAGTGSQGLKVYIYEWTDGGGASGVLDGDIANVANPNPELVIVGDGLLNITGITAGQSYQTATIDVDPFPVGTGGVSLTAGKRYLITMAEGVNHGGSAFDSGTGFWFAADEGLDYFMNVFAGGTSAGGFRSNNVWFQPFYVDEPGGTGNGWSTPGINGNFVPSIGVMMAPKTVNASLCAPITSVGEVENVVAGELMVYPNPTSSAINVEVNFEKEVENISYRLTDVMGKVISTANSANVLSEVKTFDIQSAPAGVYFITIQSDNNTMTKRFIKE
ncbi:MAG: T9SS type A sorting domain-containing protein [Aureispira sp.]|nr:T9SS type A sorting domain-containing protein [Aureispira sp.]